MDRAFDPVEEAGNESFPASDALSWTLGKEEMPVTQATTLEMPRPFPWRRMIIWTLALVAGTYLLTRHANHTLQLLPLLILMACPLMHLFHHRHRQHR